MLQSSIDLNEILEMITNSRINFDVNVYNMVKNNMSEYAASAKQSFNGGKGII
jgi:hypothetical protein